MKRPHNRLRALLVLIIVILASLPVWIGKQIKKKVDVHKVDTRAGWVSGLLIDHDSVKVFYGIPFAAPPVGDLRWKPPQKVQPWSEIRECNTPPASAMQANPVPFYAWSKEFLAPVEPLSEDCLYLNVWTTAEKRDEKLPVMVWIHGGGFTGGSGTVPLYTGDEMAKKGVVFVTINYRLGVFGFLAHPWLSAESPDSVSGNYGILDQIAALRWVKENIGAFGGDPGNITIDGQSAGAFSVNALMVSPLASGLFDRAIAESGGFFGKSSMLVQDLQSAEKAGEAFTGRLGITSLEALRQVPADTLVAAGGRWGLVDDHHVIFPASNIFGEDRQNDVPVLTGWNGNDGVSLGPPQDAESFRNNAEKMYGDNAAEFLALFPAGNDTVAMQSQHLLSQLFFGWQNYYWASIQSARGEHHAWLYYFTHVPPGEPDYGAFHSAEFGYALNTLKYWHRPFTQVDYHLADIMSSYWVNFAATGNPNGEGLPEWPAFQNSAPQIIDFGDSVKVVPLPYRKQLEFLTKLNN